MKEKEEMPQIESKIVRKYRVYKRIICEFEIIVNADNPEEAIGIANELTSICEYSDTIGMNYEEQYLDNAGYLSRIESIGTASSWVDESKDGVTCEYTYECTELFKTEDRDWVEVDYVYTDDNDLKDAWEEEQRWEETEN